MSDDEMTDFIRVALAAEEARVEKIRAELFANDSCGACGAVVADQVQHVTFHEDLRKWMQGVTKAFEQLAKPRREV